VNTEKLLGSTMLAALALATVGAGKFPPPHRYTGIFALWFLLGIVAGFGAGAARFCGALSSLVVLTMAMGVSGKRALAWLSGVGPRLGTVPPASSAPSAGGASTGAITNLIGAADRISSSRPARPR
jgi:hypothetical protein